MLNYTFHSLNDKEFEALANDLYCAYTGIHVERFRPGKDKGIDGRLYTTPDQQVVIQSKHMLGSGVSKFIKTLKTKELPKVKALNPHSYIVFTSLPLSVTDKEKIHDTFTPYIRSKSDIYAKNDINGLLTQFRNIERAHFKLWLSSTTVLEEIIHKAQKNISYHILEEAIDNQKCYVKTNNHHKAVEKLEQLHTIIIKGEPGIGKTTLAEQVCLEYFMKDFEFINVSNSIEEAYNLLNTEKKQIFYFDDFLGSNYLTAIENKEDSKIGNPP